MRDYLKYFKIPLIITAVISIVCIIIYATKSSAVDYNRYNQTYDNSQCVYDYAGKMTDDEVEYLNSYLTAVEEYNCVDIAFITIYDDENGYLENVKALAEQFAIDNSMGYDYEGGETIVFVDNWSRGGDGHIHSWIATRGTNTKSRLSGSKCEDILMILDEIPSDDADPYYQYYEIAESIYRSTRPIHPPFGMWVCLLVAVVVAVIYIALNYRSKLADITVNNATYLNGGRAEFPVMRDIFLHKTVTKRKIEHESSSSSSGGGGGGSFGGGGHSR